MRFVLAILLLLLAITPALAFCPPPAAVGSVPEQMAAQRAFMLCQQGEVQALGAAEQRQIDLEAQLRQQQIVLEQEMKTQQQLAFAATGFP